MVLQYLPVQRLQYLDFGNLWKKGQCHSGHNCVAVGQLHIQVSVSPSVQCGP